MTGSAPAPAAPEGEDYQGSWICAPRQQCANTRPPPPQTTKYAGPGSEFLG